MRSNEVFSRMSPEAAQRFLEDLMTTDPATATVVMNAIAGAFKLRARFLRRQPRAKQAEWMRKVLGRTASAGVAEEILASFFLSEQHLGHLTEWLDALGVEHEEGNLTRENPPCPEREKLESAVKAFLEGEAPERRRLLLQAFAAQSSIDWPALEEIL